jgi:hypothetical protein
VHIEGHFLGLQLIRVVRDPIREMPLIAGPLIKSILQPGGATLGIRLAGLKIILDAVLSTLRDPRRFPANDPLRRTRTTLLSDPTRLEELEDHVKGEISDVLASALVEVQA